MQGKWGDYSRWGSGTNSVTFCVINSVIFPWLNPGFGGGRNRMSRMSRMDPYRLLVPESFFVCYYFLISRVRPVGFDPIHPIHPIRRKGQTITFIRI